MLRELARLVQVLSVVAGVVISILSFNDTRQKEAEARQKDAEARQLEIAKPFLQLRQSLYTEAVKAAAVLSNPSVHTDEEKATAKKRFRDLYVAELSMVEAPEVEGAMKALASQIDKDLVTFTPEQSAAYHLAHALRDTFVEGWRIPKSPPKSP